MGKKKEIIEWVDEEEMKDSCFLPALVECAKCRWLYDQFQMGCDKCGNQNPLIVKALPHPVR